MIARLLNSSKLLLLYIIVVNAFVVVAKAVVAPAAVGMKASKRVFLFKKNKRLDRLM